MRGRPARADGGELVPARLDRLVHPVLGVVQELISELGHEIPAASSASRPGAAGSSPGRVPAGSSRPLDDTIVPTRSPETMRSMFRSSARLNTQIGRSLSM